MKRNKISCLPFLPHVSNMVSPSLLGVMEQKISCKMLTQSIEVQTAATPPCLSDCTEGLEPFFLLSTLACLCSRMKHIHPAHIDPGKASDSLRNQRTAYAHCTFAACPPLMQHTRSFFIA